MADAPESTSSLRTIPRAAESIRRARGIGTLVGFAAVFAGTLFAGGALLDAILRGIGGGIILCLAAWWLAQVYWRITLRVEMREHIEAGRAQLEALMSQRDQ